MNPLALDLLGPVQPLAWFLVGSRGPCQCAHARSDWDYLVIVANGAIATSFEYRRCEGCDVGVYQLNVFCGLVERHVPWALACLFFPRAFCSANVESVFPRAPRVCSAMLELAVYSELSTVDKAALFLREGDRAHCVKKLVHHLRMSDYAVQLVESGAIAHYDRMDDARAELDAAADPLAAFESLYAQHSAQLTRAIVESRRAAESVPIESTDALAYVCAHSPATLERHLPLRFDENGDVRCRMHVVSSRWDPDVVRVVRGVVGARIIDGRVVRPPTPFALLGAADRALLGCGKIWNTIADGGNGGAAVARRLPRPMGGELVSVCAFDGQWIVDGDGSRDAVRVVTRLLPADAVDGVCVWLHVSGSDDAAAVTQLHCIGGDGNVRIAAPPPVDMARREGWLCFDGDGALVGVEIDAAFDALWALRCQAVAKHVSVDRAREMLVALWCADAEADAELIPVVFRELRNRTWASLERLCRLCDELLRRLAPRDGRELAAHVTRIAHRRVLFDMLESGTTAQVSVQRQRAALIIDWIDASERGERGGAK